MGIPVTVDPTAWAGRTFTPAAALDIGAMQNAVAAQLVSFFAGASPALPISVYSYPDFDLDTWWQGSDIAFVLVRYRETRLTAPRSTDSMVQGRDVEFSIHVEARTTAWALTGAGSVYALIDAIEAALTGFQIPGCHNAYLTEETFGGQDAEGGVWLYDMRLKVPTTRPKQEPAYALVNLQLAIAAEVAGQSPKQRSPVTLTFAGGVIGTPARNISAVTLTDANNGWIYQAGADYVVNGPNGVISTVPGSAIADDGTMVHVTYSAADVVTATATGGRAPLYPTN
jgi:hypothetical protein